jgi:hypothetical protein
MPDLPPRQRERLAFIESRLYWEGLINRGDITACFSISKPQATLDLKLYQDLFPGHLGYDLGRRCYVPSGDFEPRLWRPDADDYLRLCRRGEQAEAGMLGFWPPTETVPRFRRNVSAEVLRAISRAMQTKTEVQIEYRSPRSPNDTRRWVQPTVLVYTLGRWHMRAYCRLREAYRSFVLGRIVRVCATADEPAEFPEDEQWQETVCIEIVPSGDVPGSASRIIEQDYGMASGKAIVPVRLALLEYFLHENRLLDSNTMEPSGTASLIRDNGQVFIANADAVEAALTRHRAEGGRQRNGAE